MTVIDPAGSENRMKPKTDENSIDEGRMSPSRVLEGEQRGWIVPIGGAEEKENDPRILERFVQLCGGSDANIVVIPTASQLADTGPRYEKLFTGLGAGEVGVLDFDMRRDAVEKNRLERLDQATGIFFTGGNQLRLSTMLGGTPVAQRIRALNARGVQRTTRTSGVPCHSAQFRIARAIASASASLGSTPSSRNNALTSNCPSARCALASSRPTRRPRCRIGST